MVDDTSAWQFNVDAPDMASVGRHHLQWASPQSGNHERPSESILMLVASSVRVITQLEPEEIDKNAFASLGNLGRSHSFYICPFTELKCPYE